MTTLTDEFVNSGPGTGCSLREAIRAANTDAAFGGCPGGSGADLITMPGGTYRFLLAGAGEDATATGDLDILSEIEIRPSVNSTSTIDAAALDRVFDVSSTSGILTIKNLRITGGDNGGASGGGILVQQGQLHVEDSLIESNTSTTFGGGISGRL